MRLRLESQAQRSTCGVPAPWLRGASGQRELALRTWCPHQAEQRLHRGGDLELNFQLALGQLDQGVGQALVELPVVVLA